MTENILLTFLSSVTLEGIAKPTPYTNVAGEGMHTTNESAARYIIEHKGNISKIFYFVTNKVRKPISEGITETHWEYFRNRVKKFMPGVEDFMTDDTRYDYDESNTEEKKLKDPAEIAKKISEKNLKSVAEMAKKIQDYAKKHDVVLHVDLTGGMRHINIIMLDIIRLLEYSGIKRGLVLYSNYDKDKLTGTVEEIQDIYSLFQLISGVEEFVNSGSVVALKKYYAEVEQSANLKNLTDAMANFAEAIKLCRYEEFKAAIEWLHDAISGFDTDSENPQDMLMARLLGKVREKYALLIATRGRDDVKIIRWCVEHGYLQQALTLYNERVPEYLYENFLTQTEENRAALELTLGKEKRSPNFYLLNNYLNESNDDFESFRKKETPAAKRYVEHLQGKKDFDKNFNETNMNKQYLEKIQQYAKEALDYLKDLKRLKSLKNLKPSKAKSEIFNYEKLQEKIFSKNKFPHGVKFPDEQELRKIFAILNKIITDEETVKKLKENPDAEEFSPIKEIIEDTIIEDTPNIKSIEFNQQPRKKIFEFLRTAKLQKLQKYFPTYKPNTKIFRLDYMVEKKIFEFNEKLDAETFFGIMEKYFILKEERNSSNHARGVSKFETAADLEKFMNEGLDEIELEKR